ncbi:MAG: redoxin domain-containing protein [bacterium]|nr:redoxin domain-containing protein [bacterium]
MSQSPHQKIGSKRYEDAWRAINVLIRSDGSWSGQERNSTYLNNRDGTFRDVSFVSGLDFPADGRSMAALDVDRDGDLDLVLKSRTAPQLRIMRNEAGDRRGLRVELVGNQSNRDAVGARATLETSSRRLMREVRSGSGYLSQPSRRLHFGLLPGETVKALEVRWPGGRRQQIEDLPASGAIRITEGESEAVEIPVRTPRATQPEAKPRPEPRPGTWLVEPVPAPDFTLKGLDGNTLRLSEQTGRKVLLNFWATWCPPCREELADLAANSRKLSAAGVDVVTVSVDEPTERERVREFALKQKLTFPVLHADDRAVAAYTVLNRHLFDRRRDLGIPTSFLIDEQGRIIKVYLGATPASAILADASAAQRPALPFQGTWYSPPPGRDYVEIATAMTVRGLPEAARMLFEAALSARHSSPELYNNFAALLFKEEELDRAEELLRKSLALQPNQVEAQVNLGALLVRRGDPQQGIRYLELARPSRPDDAFVHSALGSALFAIGKLPESERSYREALRLDPASAENHFNLGSVLAATGRYAEALPVFEKVRALGGDSVKLMSNLGILYMETGQPARALAEFQRAVEAAPADYGSHLNLAMYWLRTGEPAQALDWARKASRLDPDSPASYLVEARALIAQDQTTEARTVIERLLKTHPNLPEATDLLRSLK